MKTFLHKFLTESTHQIHKELTDDLGYYEESFGGISIKPKELIPLTSVQLELFNL